ncbi:nitroreductase family protein [Ralstonia insidiosa]|jgi:SagB-type dehydrogenase family enzyme|nr:nitroreductase family protein [Ralstonia insidiosa]KMW48603.1 nitroreductase [Ralstonia sp. MD27]MBX3772681.1 nitroreductase family protein [Ralstonia pickettii]NOZ17629.1 SagB/ThcOx family dehydrogenase [Betaproteobacteria bacterium]MBA9856541.1 SagB/ThcOx family dehydrogenase [Ralstonia insidiosa]MBA9869106.1 SagB/ThcOx family dehydrogenase [Ralstonia insidiosa]
MSEAMLLSYAPVHGALPKPTAHTAPAAIALPPPHLGGGTVLMTALAKRKSVRAFAQTPLSLQQLSELLWAADGINRPETGGHTAPSAHGLNEVDIYVALPEGVYRYEPEPHRLRLKHAVDARNLTGYQDFVGTAPLDLVYVVNHARADQMPQSQRETFSGVAAGAISQNVSLYCASAGLACVVRGWLNHRLLAEALSLNEDEMPVLAQTVGHPISV